ncbi:MAG: 4-hydroxy-3-methylbut-2-enyl diphosphate reductase [Pseudomonadota bacterium]
MKIRLAKSSGFCMGVRRAVELALEAVHSRQGPIFSYGPLIHNPQAMALLESRGLTALEGDPENLAGIEQGTIILRAHGVPPRVYEELERLGLEVIDATCPRVVRVQAIIRAHAAEGYMPIIWGNPDHPEVMGLLGHADKEGRVISGPEEVSGLPAAAKVILVAQTTQNINSYPEVAAAVRSRWPEAMVFNTICDSTKRRQDDVRRLAREVEAMVVVGGHASANTKRLAAAAEAEGVKTIHVETEEELDRDWLAGMSTVGVTAGASTPNWMIKRVIRAIERLDRRSGVSLHSFARRLLRVLVLSNLYTAVGSGLLCLAGAMLQGMSPRTEYFGVTFFYVYAMHVLNLFLDKEASQYNDPDRVVFLEKYKVFLLGSGVLSALVSLGLAFTLSIKVLLLLAVMSTLGLLYAVPLVPKSWAARIKFRRLKDIPSSKTVSLSGGWAFCLALAPALSPEGRLQWSTVLVLAVICLLVFIRSALGDIIEIQGDRIVGRETIPILIGEKKTLHLLRLATGLLAAALFLGWWSGLFPSLALVLLVCAAYAFFYVILFQQERIMGSGLQEALIDANFILAGVASWVWLVFHGT